MNKILRFIVGTIFLLSGLLKAIGAATFADLMSQYGATWLGLGAPLIILVEVIIGLMLVFDFYPKHTAIAASAFLVFVSAVYLYGIVAKDITDCGCFGPLTWLNTKPWLTFIRNIILLGLLVPSLLTSDATKQASTASIAFMAVIATIVMFMCGFSMHGAKCLHKERHYQPVALADTPLSAYVTCPYDSTCLVFAFSYGCPYCQNSIGNVNQYLPMGVADKVIGLAVEDTIARNRFKRIFETNFEIREISALQMYNLSRTLPTTFFIRHDSIIMQYTGMVVSPALMIP